MRGRAGAVVAARSAESLAAEFGAAYRTRSTRTEILMGDFYGGRPFILKFMPWWGQVLEAGCGLGRYVFYLRRLGYDAIGVEISEDALKTCRDYARRAGEDPAIFRRGDVRALDLPSDSLAAYLSLGVVEHFEEGPERALQEAHRVLAPGGVAILCTPNALSLEHLYDSARVGARRLVRHSIASTGLARPPAPRRFDQYWYSAIRLARFARRAGFITTVSQTVDLKYAAHETLKLAGHSPGPAWRCRLFRAMDALESTPLAVFGALSFVIAIKDGARRCFFCGEPRVPDGRLTWSVPVCCECARISHRDLLRAYAPGCGARFAWREIPGAEGEPLCGVTAALCRDCGARFEPDPDFGLYGLARPTCTGCLRQPARRAELILDGLCEQWRPRL